MPLAIIGIFIALIIGSVVAFESLATPQFLSSVSQISMPSGVAFFADAFQLDSGLAIIVSAYTLRFLIRRIPIIG